METQGRIEELSGLFRFLAEHDFAGYSPLYERIALTMATDPELLAFVDDAAAPNSRRGRVPVLFHATLHEQAMRHPDELLGRAFVGDPSVDLHAAIGECIALHRDDVVATMRSRSVQTNEVGRSAAIAMGLAAASPDGRGVALIELGPSAGLNLFVDHWHIDYVRDGASIASCGPTDSPVQLACELRGPLEPSATAVPTIAHRTGVDPSPIDASDPDQARWLQACVWPGVPERPQRLAAALSVVALDPPPLVRGDAVTDLAPLVAATDAELLPIVLSTWALAYVSAEGRARVLDELDAIGAERDLAIVTLEEPRFTPWIELPDELVTIYYETGDGTPTVLGLRRWIGGECTSKVLAVCHPHVRWMRWLDDGDDRG